MRHAEKEVEQLEKIAREEAGLPVEPENEGEPLPPIELPPFRVLQRQRRLAQKVKADKERKELEEKVAEIEAQIQAANDRLKALNEGSTVVRVSPEHEENSEKEDHRSRDALGGEGGREISAMAMDRDGALGPDGSFVEFPAYDGGEPPTEWKKPFTHYCNKTRKNVKARLSPEDRKNKVRRRGEANIFVNIVFDWVLTFI